MPAPTGTSLMRCSGSTCGASMMMEAISSTRSCRTHFGFMETPDIMEALKRACLVEPELRGIDPQNITYYFRRVMVIPSGKASGMALWRKSLFATMHLNANLPAAYFGVPAAQVVEVGLEVEI
jgi:KUP system potassium uptake protein